MNATFDTPLPEITATLNRPHTPLPPIFEQPPAVEKTNAIAAGIASVQGEVAKFDQIAAGLKAIEDAHPKNVIVAAIETPAGMKQAEASWRAYRNPRLEVERARKAAKAPVLALGKAIDTFAGGLEERLREGEDHYRAQIDAEEDRRAAIKAEQERIERAAAEKHAARRAAISMYLLRCQEPGMTADRISNGMAMLQRADMSDPFTPRAVELADLQCRTLESMRTLHAQAVAREQEAARQEAIRLENERRAAELAEAERRIAAEAEALRRAAAELAAREAAAREADAKRDEDARIEAMNREELRLQAIEREAQERHIEDRQADPAPVLTGLDEALARASAIMDAMPAAAPAAVVAESATTAEVLAREAQIHAAGTAAMQAEARKIDAPAPRVVLLEEPAFDPVAELQALAAEARASRFPSQPKMGAEWWSRWYAAVDAMA